MAEFQTLSGNELIDCARANATLSLEKAAYRSGYGDDIQGFKQALTQACEEIGISEIKFADLANSEEHSLMSEGVEIAPDTLSKL